MLQLFLSTTLIGCAAAAAAIERGQYYWTFPDTDCMAGDELGTCGTPGSATQIQECKVRYFLSFQPCFMIVATGTSSHIATADHDSENVTSIQCIHFRLRATPTQTAVASTSRTGT
jgi:hypothetical protein